MTGRAGPWRRLRLVGVAAAALLGAGRAAAQEGPPPAGEVFSVDDGVVTVEPAPRSPFEVLRRATHMTSADAARLEERLVEEPTDAAARLQLVEYYGSRVHASGQARERHREHVLWLVREVPLSEWTRFAGGLSHLTDAAGYREGVRLWERHREERPDEPQVLARFASWVSLADPERAIELLVAAAELDPCDPTLVRRVGDLWARPRKLESGAYAPYEATAARLAYAKALEQLGRRDPECGVSDEERLLLGVDIRSDAALMAAYAGDCEDARSLAPAVLAELEGESELPRFVTDVARNTCATALGLCALREQRVEEAEEWLLRSVEGVESSALSHFGPRTGLARALAERGRVDAVVAFLRAGVGSWLDEGQAAARIAAVEAGDLDVLSAGARY